MTSPPLKKYPPHFIDFRTAIFMHTSYSRI